MRRSSLWFLALAPLAAAACEDGGEADVQAPPVETATVTETAPAPAPASGGVVDLPAEQTPDRDYLVQMVPLEGQTYAGTVGFTPAGDRTEVTVAIEGGAAGATSQGHVHRGDDCDQIGEVVQPLPAVPMGGAGAADTIPMAMQAVMDGNHLVIYHEPGGAPGTPVLCADVPVLPPNLPPE